VYGRLNYRLMQCVAAVNAWCWEINLATDCVTKLWVGLGRVTVVGNSRGQTVFRVQLVDCRSSEPGAGISLCSSDTWRRGAALQPPVTPTLHCTVACHQSATSADVNISLCNNTTEPNIMNIGWITIVIILISYLHCVHKKRHPFYARQHVVISAY